MSRSRERPDTELNLSSMIDILSIMLFFLMATVSFLTLKTLNAAVPAASKGAVSTTDGVNVSLEIRTDGYVVTASGQPEDKKEKKLNVNETIPLLPQAVDGLEYDIDALSRKLWDIKKKAPEVKNIMINPGPGTPFHVVIATMDASRERRSDLDKNRSIPLFTRPVLTELEE